MYSSITRGLCYLKQCINPSANVILPRKSVFFRANIQSEIINVTDKWNQHNNRAYSTLKPLAQSMFDKGLKDIAKLYPADHILHNFLVTEYYNLMSKFPYMTVEDLINEITQFPEEDNADHYFLRAEELEKSKIFEEAAASYALAKELNPEKYKGIVDKRIPPLIEKSEKHEKERLEHIRKLREQLSKK